MKFKNQKNCFISMGCVFRHYLLLDIHPAFPAALGQPKSKRHPKVPFA
jgi:hypothetical protein